ncbi:MAG TPA: hypothetical protein PKE21_10135 [Flavobacteriales bacterium]|nr:hypothetical protein [Flavobacteriales bacterium]HMR27825.1 hypothetical protein [Flavobacteriales bacterium]
MRNTSHPDRTWARTGGICGIAAILAYFGAAFLPVPDTAALVLAFAFGPLVAIASLGLVHAVERGPARVGARIAGFLGAAAGVTVLAMLTVQQALFAAYGRVPESDPSRMALVELGNAVHFGLDIAWDCLIAASITLFAIHLWRASRFGKVLSITGVLCGTLLFGINMAAFPDPPDSIGMLDMGPFCALWMLAVYGWMIGQARQ